MVDKEISYDTIGKLISFLLNDFSYVRSVEINQNEFELGFIPDLGQFDKEGISCNEVNIRFDTSFRLKDNFANLFQDYLNYIVSNFTMEMLKTPQIMEMYKKYLSDMKEKIITSFTPEELQQFIQLLSEVQLRELLLSMDNEQFFNLCDGFLKEDNNPKGNGYELRRKPIKLGDGG